MRSRVPITSGLLLLLALAASSNPTIFTTVDAAPATTSISGAVSSATDEPSASTDSGAGTSEVQSPQNASTPALQPGPDELSVNATASVAALFEATANTVDNVTNHIPLASMSSAAISYLVPMVPIGTRMIYADNSSSPYALVAVVHTAPDGLFLVYIINSTTPDLSMFQFNPANGMLTDLVWSGSGYSPHQSHWYMAGVNHSGLVGCVLDPDEEQGTAYMCSKAYSVTISGQAVSGVLALSLPASQFHTVLKAAIGNSTHLGLVYEYTTGKVVATSWEQAISMGTVQVGIGTISSQLQMRKALDELGGTAVLTQEGMSNEGVSMLTSQGWVNVRPVVSNSVQSLMIRIATFIPTTENPTVFSTTKKAYRWHDHGAAISQANASKECIRRGGSLATIRHEQDQIQLFADLKASAPAAGFAYIAGVDIEQSEEWRWKYGPLSEQDNPIWSGLSDGVCKQPSGYSNWDGGEPNNHGGQEDAMGVRGMNQGFGWNDAPSVGDVASYICELPHNVTCEGQQFFCAADLTCTEHVCDGVSDCSDAADEAGCWTWSVVDKDSIFGFNESHSHTHRVAETFAECRKLAVIAATNAFAFNQDTLHCIVYRTKNTVAAFAKPADYLVANATTVGYALYVHEEILFFEGCSRFLHCSGNGDLLAPVDYSRGCRCACDAEHTGETCSERKDPAGLDRHVVFVSYTYDEKAPPPWYYSLPDIAAITSALAQGDHTGTIQDGTFEPYNATHAKLEFTLNHPDPNKQAQYRLDLLTATTLRRIQARLAATLVQADRGQKSTILKITASSPFSRSVPLPGCIFHGLDVACTPTSSGAAATQLTSSVTVKARSIVPGFNITYTKALTNSSSSSSDSVAFRAMDLASADYRSTSGNISVVCEQTKQRQNMAWGVSTKKRPGGEGAVSICIKVACTLRFPEPILLRSLSVTGASRFEWADYSREWALANDPHGTCTSVFEVSSRQVVEVAAQLQEDAAEVTKDPRPIWWPVLLGGFNLLMALILLAAGVCLHSLHHQALMDWAEDNTLKARTLAGLFIGDGYARRQYHRLQASGHVTGVKELSGVKLIVLSVVLAMAGGFALALYLVSDSEETNFRIYLETYRDSDCSKSEFASVPFQFQQLSALDRCESVAFPTTETFFIKGRCAPSTVELAIAESKADCQGNPSHVSINSGACLLASEVGLPGIEGFVRASCLHEDTANARTRAFEQLIGVVPPGLDLVKASPPRPDLLPPNITTSGVSTWPYLSQGLTANSSFASSTTETLVGYYSKDYFDGEKDGRRIITQYAHEEVLTLGANGSAPRTRMFENAGDSHVADYANLNDTLSGLPSVPGYLLGNVYNNFETEDARNGKQAGAASHRYFGVIGSQFDLGQHYGGEEEDRDFGFTISLWLRANSKSVGFPFILADGYEDAKLQQSVIVNRLLDVLRTGKGNWFEENWNVYLGLYVHGPSKTLSLVQAHTTPPSQGRKAPTAEELLIPGVLKQTWYLEEIGRDIDMPLSRLFNGLWHKVDLIFFMENDRIKVRLAVDSQTSLSLPGFSLCTTWPVQPVKASRVRKVSDIAVTRLYDGGVMYVGYFSGAVGRLQVTPEVAESYAIARAGTKTMQNLSHISLLWFRVLGAALLTAACIFTLFTLLEHTREILQAKEKRTTDLREEGMGIYYAMFLNHPVTDLNGNTVAPLSYLEAMHFLSLDDDEMFVALLRDIVTADGATMASRTLTRALYSVADPASTSFLPSAEDWQMRVVKGVQEQTALQGLHTMASKAQSEKAQGEKIIAQLSQPKQHQEMRSKVAASFEHSLYDMLMPVLQLFQMVGIYATDLAFPDLYEEIFGRLFKFLNFDFLLKIPEIPAWVTPSLLSSLGFSVLLSVVYTGVADNGRFKIHLATYAQRRDEWDADEMLAKHDDPRQQQHGNNGLPSSPVPKDQPVPPTPAPLAPEVTSVQVTTPELPSLQSNELLPPRVLRSRAETLSPVVLVLNDGSGDEQPFTLSAAAENDERNVKVNRKHGLRKSKAEHLRDVHRRVEGMEPPQERLPEYRYEEHLIPPRARSRIDGFFLPPGKRRQHRVDFEKRLNSNTATTKGGSSPEATGVGRDSPTELVIVMDDMSTVTALLSDPYEAVEVRNNAPGRFTLEDTGRTEDANLRPDVQETEHLPLTLARVFAENRDEPTTKWIEAVSNDRGHNDPAPLPNPLEVVPAGGSAAAVVDVPARRGEKLRIVDHMCPIHRCRRLGAMQATVIYPFNFKPSCCIVDNGIQCGTHVGTIFACGVECRDDKPDPVYKAKERSDGGGEAEETSESVQLRKVFDEQLVQRKEEAVRNGEFPTALDWDDHDKKTHVYRCPYAVCESHFKPPLGDELKARTLGKVRAAAASGGVWLMTMIVVALTTVVYTPYIRNCLMFLSCHRFYQCDFGCMYGPAQMDRGYGFFFTALFGLVCFGVGLPVGQWYLLWKRKSWLLTAMCSDEYKGKYLERTDGPHVASTPEEEAAEINPLERRSTVLSQTASSTQGSRSGPGLTIAVLFSRVAAEHRRSNGEEATAALWAPMNQAAIATMQYSEYCDTTRTSAGNDEGVNKNLSFFAASQEERKKKRKRAQWRHGFQMGMLSTAAWGDFLGTDETGLRLLYHQLEFDWMFLMPALFFVRFALVVPNVIFQPDSFAQLAGIGGAEFCFAVFVFWSKPYHSPWTDLTMQVGSIHQLLLIGLQSFHRIQHSEGDKVGLTMYAMMTCTTLYVVFIAFFIFILILWPVIKKRRTRRNLAERLSALGLYPVSQATLYKKPKGFKAVATHAEFRPWILIQERFRRWQQHRKAIRGSFSEVVEGGEETGAL